VDLLVRSTGANEGHDLGDGIGVAIAHDGDQIFQKCPVIVKVVFLLDEMGVLRDVAGGVLVTSYGLSSLSGAVWGLAVGAVI